MEYGGGIRGSGLPGPGNFVTDSGPDWIDIPWPGRFNSAGLPLLNGIGEFRAGMRTAG